MVRTAMNALLAPTSPLRIIYIMLNAVGPSNSLSGPLFRERLWENVA